MNPVVVPMRAAVERLQAELIKLPQIEPETHHYFADGMYLRTVWSPAGSVIVGKVHKTEHFYALLSGRIRVTTDNGVVELDANKNGPQILTCPVGTKRAVLVLEDAWRMNVHRNPDNLTDLDKLESELIEPDTTALFDANNKVQFDVPAFRTLTQRVINGEKPGFWSDWTELERELYKSGDWESFSRSRGYMEEDIRQYRAWRDQIVSAKKAGFNPYLFISDLATKAALKNMAMDTKGEILKSSHAPFEPREEIT